jgi:hypothetical protein
MTDRPIILGRYEGALLGAPGVRFWVRFWVRQAAEKVRFWVRLRCATHPPIPPGALRPFGAGLDRLNLDPSHPKMNSAPRPPPSTLSFLEFMIWHPAPSRLPT